MMCRLSVAASIPVVIAACVGSAYGDDLFPAPFRDFSNPFYTIQDWEFHTPTTPLTPDGPVATISPGLPHLLYVVNATWTPNFNGSGLDGYVGGQGGGRLHFYVANVVDNEVRKDMRIQVNGIWTPPANKPLVESMIGILDGPVTPVPAFFGGADPFPGFHRYEDWSIFPNPAAETFDVTVPEGQFINQVLVETISYPEPASLALLGIGGLAVCRRRR